MITKKALNVNYELNIKVGHKIKQIHYIYSGCPPIEDVNERFHLTYELISKNLSGVVSGESIASTYRKSSIKRRGAYLRLEIFGAALNRGRRLIEGGA